MTFICHSFLSLPVGCDVGFPAILDFVRMHVCLLMIPPQALAYPLPPLPLPFSWCKQLFTDLGPVTRPLIKIYSTSNSCHETKLTPFSQCKHPVCCRFIVFQMVISSGSHLTFFAALFSKIEIEEILMTRCRNFSGKVGGSKGMWQVFLFEGDSQMQTNNVNIVNNVSVNMGGLCMNISKRFTYYSLSGLYKISSI